ncbi:MAG TPA: GNAT family N-acetyltransferase [Candidatus Wallbacteria bacterium]|nr:GNAT family N-acetyltransferase [Candidatus Wallbacteria bacterium]
MNIIFKRAELNDVPELIRVQNLSFRDDFEKYGECPAYGESPENMTDMVKNAIVYKVISASRIIGDIIVRKKENSSYYLRTLAILPEFQNMKIGARALEFIEKDNPDGIFWFLITPSDNPRNRHFYEKHGYKKAKEITRSKLLTLIEYVKN